MNWITNFVRPRIKGLMGARPSSPDTLWHKCPSCGEMIFHRDLIAAQNVCPQCGHHMRIGAKERFAALLDGAPEILPAPEVPQDPLRFRDDKRYADRLKENRAKTGQPDALIAARGIIGGIPAILAVQNFAFMGGSLGLATGAAFVAAVRVAVAEKRAFVLVFSSGGARMQEGILSLIQMPRSIIAVEEVKAAGLPYIVILTDPTTGGVSASFAMLGDITLAEPAAVIGFAGARVIEETIREKLPEGFQRSEYLLEHGMVDMVVPRAQLRETLARLIGLLRQKTPPAEIVPLPSREADAAEATAE